MTHPTPDSQITPRLDDETERRIRALPRLAQALLGHTTVRIVPDMADRAHAYDDAENALRSRIRELVEEARKKGKTEGISAMSELAR